MIGIFFNLLRGEGDGAGAGAGEGAFASAGISNGIGGILFDWITSGELKPIFVPILKNNKLNHSKNNLNLKKGIYYLHKYNLFPNGLK